MEDLRPALEWFLIYSIGLLVVVLVTFGIVTFIAAKRDPERWEAAKREFYNSRKGKR